MIVVLFRGVWWQQGDNFNHYTLHDELVELLEICTCIVYGGQIVTSAWKSAIFIHIYPYFPWTDT